MSRPFIPAAKILRSLAAVAVAAALATAGAALSSPLPAMGAQAALGDGVRAPTAVSRYCYNWDFLNNTGQDADDLHIRLKGIRTVSGVYTGALNPFGAPDASSGYDAGTDTYALNFSNGTAFAGDWVHIGLCTDQPVLVLPQGAGLPPFTWTLRGQPLQPAPLFAGLTWNWRNRRQLQVQLTNDRQVSMTLMSLNLLDAGNALELDDLNASVASGLPMVSNLAPSPVPLAPGAPSFFDVFFDAGNQALLSNAPEPDHAALLEPNHPYVLEAVLVADDDPGNAIHLYSQALSPPELLYLPIVRKG